MTQISWTLNTDSLFEGNGLEALLGQPLTTRDADDDFSLASAQFFTVAFMKCAEQQVRLIPTAKITTEEKNRILRILGEEWQEELVKAINDDDLTEVADAIGDSIYVLLSVASSYGIFIAPILREICENNHLKTLAVPKRIVNGKLIKPEGHPKPRIVELLSLMTTQSQGHLALVDPPEGYYFTGSSPDNIAPLSERG